MNTEFVVKNIGNAGGTINWYSEIKIDCCGYFYRIIEAIDRIS